MIQLLAEASMVESLPTEYSVEQEAGGKLTLHRKLECPEDLTIQLHEPNGQVPCYAPLNERLLTQRRARSHVRC